MVYLILLGLKFYSNDLKFLVSITFTCHKAISNYFLGSFFFRLGLFKIEISDLNFGLLYDNNNNFEHRLRINK